MIKSKLSKTELRNVLQTLTLYCVTSDTDLCDRSATKNMIEIKTIGIISKQNVFFYYFGLLKSTHPFLVSMWPFLEKYSFLSVIGLVFFGLKKINVHFRRTIVE